jgi:hypothetical protein
VGVTPVDVIAVLKGAILVAPVKVDLPAATEATIAVVIVADLQDAVKALAMSAKAVLTTVLTLALNPHNAEISRLVETLHPVRISSRVVILRRVRRHPVEILLPVLRHLVVILERHAEISAHANLLLASRLVLLNQAMGAKYLFHETLKNVPRATQTKSVDQAMPLRRASSRNKAAWSKSAMPFFMPCA